MDKTFEQGKDEVARLCAHFQVNRDEFCACNEAQIRQQLINPFFEALGWDVGNTGQVAPQYAEVLTEQSQDDEGPRKAPDYTFRIGTLPKFYAEAKRCSIDISSDPAPAFQLRRYGWNKPLSPCLLTNFGELGVYDCTARPRQSDKPSRSRISLYKFQDYPDRWRELWDIFSREAVWSGAFDRYAASKRKLPTSEFDAEFLKEIEGWRDTLARNIALRNKELSSDDLNAAVQATIDRVVFLRMAEDRGLEPYEQLLKLCERDGVYPRFMRNLCRKADEKYNSGLFHFQKEEGVPEAPDRITPNLVVDDRVFKPILQSLYFEHGSPYDFRLMPVEILGTIYERFLGKVIRLTAGHQAKVEEKPEVRAAKGIHYTPAFIAKYIVGQTVGRQIEGRSPAQLLRGKGKPLLRILDMACGSGTFLLGAYQCLLDHCLEWYTQHKPETHKKAVYRDSPNGGWRLTIQEKKRILRSHVFGVDIDAQAVEVTKLSLLLKVLEGETDQSVTQQHQLFHDRALPNLADNIKCGNSLIGQDYFDGKLQLDPQEMKRINPFDWQRGFPDAMQAGGFDCVIGNPPYIRMEAFKELKTYLKANFACHDERSDQYAYFIERAHKLLEAGGRFGMIVSNKFLRARYGRPLREFLRSNATVERVVDLAGLPVFQGATVRTIILLTSQPRRDRYDVLYSPPVPPDVFEAVAAGSLRVEQAIAESSYPVAAEALNAAIWSFSRQETDDLIARVAAACLPLSEYCEGRICMGVKSGLMKAFVIDGDTRTAILKRNPKAREILKPFLNGRDVRRYHVDPKGLYLIYTYHGVRIQDFPAVEEHLRPFKAALEQRATQQAWYELQQPQYAFSALMDRPKIIFPDIATPPRFALDETGFYSGNTTYFIARPDLYLLGLLNSRLAYCYFAKTCAGLEGKNETYLRFFGQYLENFPVRALDLSEPADAAARERMMRLVGSMQTLHKQLAAANSAAQKTVVQRRIDATDAEIDRLVYDLYGLTAEEIAVVESSAG
jgi:type I restriction-modification system DNA methylase subunit